MKNWLLYHYMLQEVSLKPQENSTMTLLNFSEPLFQIKEQLWTKGLHLFLPYVCETNKGNPQPQLTKCGSIHHGTSSKARFQERD